MANYSYPRKRYMREYANDKVRDIRRLIKEYPQQKEDFLQMINEVNRAVWLYERGYIIVDEAMRLIADA